MSSAAVMAIIQSLFVFCASHFPVALLSSAHRTIVIANLQLQTTAAVAVGVDDREKQCSSESICAMAVMAICGQNSTSSREWCPLLVGPTRVHD